MTKIIEIGSIVSAEKGIIQGIFLLIFLLNIVIRNIFVVF